MASQTIKLSLNSDVFGLRIDVKSPIPIIERSVRIDACVRDESGNLLSLANWPVYPVTELPSKFLQKTSEPTSQSLARMAWQATRCEVELTISCKTISRWDGWLLMVVADTANDSYLNIYRFDLGGSR